MPATGGYRRFDLVLSAFLLLSMFLRSTRRGQQRPMGPS
ncbi:hypothetical protein SFR_7034 (plasmid) [Streptomyces sp. FR-008]|nr:hypothetical protein SFR_7034 [Streptomyces sp. FR-008]